MFTYLNCCEDIFLYLIILEYIIVKLTLPSNHTTLFNISGKPTNQMKNKNAYTRTHIYINLDAYGIMDSFIENGYGDMSSNPRGDCLHLT